MYIFMAVCQSFPLSRRAFGLLVVEEDSVHLLGGIDGSPDPLAFRQARAVFHISRQLYISQCTPNAIFCDPPGSTKLCNGGQCSSAVQALQCSAE
jgi:hypothetical protein